ncbi:hypothetical protein [Rurimicrobium arvi]|uniref:Outer membrane lipoprotein-sorting protein n=1 Tax=Rurimicrobium arvi TaxID=2049916 RepID=A0ABP8MSA8_9BACT
MMKKCFLLLTICILSASHALLAAGDPNQLFVDLRKKVTSVKDYVADVKMNIFVSFMKVPPMNGRLYFKSPDKVKLERNGGISILPKKTVNISLNNLIPSGSVTVLDAGTEMVNGTNTRILKVLPDNESADIILSKIWVDESRQLALRTETTTRENGTVKMELEYGKYAAQALPDKVTITMDVKDYKMPKSLAMDYDEANDAQLMERAKKAKDKKGRIQIRYLSYRINSGLSDAVFVEKKK